MGVWAQRAPHKCRTLAAWESRTFHGVSFSMGCSGALGMRAAGSVNASHQSSASPLGLPQTSQWYVSVNAIQTSPDLVRFALEGWAPGRYLEAKANYHERLPGANPRKW